MKKEYYKVVIKENEKYYSAWVKREAEFKFLTIEYPLNKWVYPRLKDSLLFCFDNLYDAKTFAARCHTFPPFEYDVIIFRCEIGKNFPFKRDLPQILDWNTSISPKTLKERLRIWWRGDKLPKIKLGGFSWQDKLPGTVLTDKIKLIKEEKL